MKKKGLNHLIVYLETAAVSVLSVVQAQREVLPMPAGIALYALAAVSVAAAAVCLYKDLREGVIDRILMTVKRSALGARFLEDYTFRTILTTMPAFLINVAYTVYNEWCYRDHEPVRVVYHDGGILQPAGHHALPGGERGKKNIAHGGSAAGRKKAAVSHQDRRDTAHGAEPGSVRRRPAYDSAGDGKGILGDHGDLYRGVYLL